MSARTIKFTDALYDYYRGVAVREPAVAMEGETVIGTREAFEESVFEHAASAAADLLGRLADKDERALPLRLE